MHEGATQSPSTPDSAATPLQLAPENQALKKGKEEAETALRILQVAASLSPNSGGPTVGAINLNAALRSLGHAAEIYATDAEGVRSRYDRSKIPQSGNGMPLISIFPRSWPHRWANSWKMAAALIRKVRQVDIVHIHGTYLAHSMWAMFACMLWRRPYVLQPHGSLEPYQNKTSKVVKRLYNNLVGKATIGAAMTLIAASQAERDNLRSQFPKANVALTPLGASSKPPKQPTSVNIDRWRSVEQHRRVAYIGRLASKKRPDLLLDAWNIIGRTDAQLLVAGPSDTWTPDGLSNMVDDRLRHSVICTGCLDQSEVSAVLQEAGIFVLPSENENFGIAVIEAMLNGCAVVSTEQTAAARYVSTAFAGVVLPYPSSTLLAAALNELLNDPLAVRTMSANAGNYARKNLSWSNTSKLLVEEYNLAINRHAKRSKVAHG